MPAHVEAQIEGDASGPAARVTRRTTRVVTPTAATTRPSRRATFGITTSTKTNGTQCNDASQSAPEAVPDKMVEAMTQVLREVKDLKGIIVDQASVIDGMKKQHAQELSALRGQMQTITTEFKHMREELEDIKNSQAAIASAQTSPHASYASVARTTPTSQPTNVRTLSTMNTSPSTYADTLFCTIDTTRVGEESPTRWDAGTTRAAVEKQIRTIEGHQGWRCRAVTIDPKKPQRIRIFCRDESEHELVKKVAEKVVSGGARVLRDELYPIKVDSVRRDAVLDPEGKIHLGAAEAFGRENETTVAKISWLSKKEVPKLYGSMVVYLTRAADARRILEEGFFYAGGESGFAGTFERRDGPMQCYQCQQIGHKAFQSQNTQKCGRCAKGGHTLKECTEIVLKCVPCGGPHESFSRNCPKLYPVLNG